MRLKMLAAAVALAAAFAAPAQADLVITGRDAQKLQCAGLMMVAMAAMQANGQLSAVDKQLGTTVISAMMSGLPGTKREHMAALRQRSERIFATRKPEHFVKEFHATRKWCATNLID